MTATKTPRIIFFFIFIPFTFDGIVSLAWQSVGYPSCGVCPWMPFSLHLLSSKPNPSIPPFLRGIACAALACRASTAAPEAHIDVSFSISDERQRCQTRCSSAQKEKTAPFIHPMYLHIHPTPRQPCRGSHYRTCPSTVRRKTSPGMDLSTGRSSDSHVPARRKPFHCIPLRVG